MLVYQFSQRIGKTFHNTGLKFLFSQWWCYGYVVKNPTLDRVDSNIAKLVDDIGCTE